MMLGARAGIRDGRDTLFWSARWLDSGVILADWANESNPDFNLLDSVVDFTYGDEAPRDGLGDDIVIWGEKHDGRFSISSAYNLLTDQGSQQSEVSWERIWRWKGPHRINLFLWLATNERLFTNVERARRHISTSAVCPRCGSEIESVGHVLRDCRFAAETWTSLGFRTDDRGWDEAMSNWIIGGIQGEAGLLFGTAAWLIWKARNEAIFANKLVSPSRLASRIRSWVTFAAEAFNRDARCLGLKKPKEWKSIAWDPGPEDAITVNTDGSFNPSRNKATAGGIIRRSDGRGLVAFTMNLGCCTITRAEIRGAISGLEHAWDYGFRQVELQLDSQAAVAILLSPEDPQHQYMAEVLYFRELCGRDWRVRTRHVYKEANKAADFLAGQGYEFPFGIHLFLLSDCNLGHILRYDVLGITELRLISVDE
ncbi:Putative ribonuclease H protein At1g65750 [Linum perenne]